MRVVELALALSLGLLTGCPVDGSAGADPLDGSLPDLAVPAPECVVAPRTHVEILNACTDAQFVNKRAVLPLLRPDGTLPPLP